MSAPSPLARRPRNSLTREVIVRAALAVSEREGYEGLTFQALGAQLGAHPTSIYRHFRDKDELMLALVEALDAEVLDELGPPAGDWIADLRQLGTCLHHVFLRHPAVSQVAAVRTTRTPAEFQLVECILASLRAGGFSVREAAVYYRLFSDFVLGYAALDAGLAALAPDTKAGDMRAWQVDYPAATAEEYPHIAVSATAIPPLDDPDNFARALDLLLEALAARALGNAPQGYHNADLWG